MTEKDGYDFFLWLKGLTTAILFNSFLRIG